MVITPEMCEFFGCVDAGGWNWVAIGAIGTWFVGLVGAVLVAYQIWLQIFARKIRVISYAADSDTFHGDGFDITLLNETLSPKSITKIKLVSDNKYIVTVKEFDEPLILEPYKAIKITGDRYTEIDNKLNLVLADKYFIIEIDGHNRFIKYKGKINKRKASKLIPMTTAIISKYDNEFLSKSVCAVLLYRLDKKDNFNKIFIVSSGFMDKIFLGSNQAPKEAMKDIDALRSYFNNLIDRHQIECEIGIQGVGKWHNK